MSVNIKSNSKKIKDEERAQLSVDIINKTDKIIILAPIAGVKEKDVHIIVNKDTLTIEGERKHRYENNEENFHTKECYWGKFSRSIVLPLEAQTEKIKAKFTDNVLEIEIPITKRAEEPQIIKIKKS